MWVGRVKEGWGLAVKFEEETVAVWGLGGDGCCWYGERSEEELATRAKVEGGAVGRLRGVLEGRMSGVVKVNAEGVLRVEVPFGRGTVVAGRMELRRGVLGFGDQVMAELARERDVRRGAEAQLAELRERYGELERAMEVCCRAKEELEEKMLLSFSAVLNEKKRKLADLMADSTVETVFSVRRDPAEEEREDTDGERATAEEKASLTLGTVPLEELL